MKNKTYLKEVSNAINILEKRYEIFENRYISKIYDIAEKSVLSKIDRLLFGKLQYFTKNDSYLNANGVEEVKVKNESDDVRTDGFKMKLFTLINKKYIDIIKKNINIDSIFRKNDSQSKTYSYVFSENTLNSLWAEKYFDSETIFYKQNKKNIKRNICTNIFNKNLIIEKNKKYQYSILNGKNVFGLKIMDKNYDSKHEYYNNTVLFLVTNDKDIAIEINKKYIGNIYIHLTNENNMVKQIYDGYDDYKKLFVMDVVDEPDNLVKFIDTGIHHLSFINDSLFVSLITKYCYFNPQHNKIYGLNILSNRKQISIDVSEKNSHIKFFNLPYYENIENKIDSMIESKNASLYSNFIINGDGGTGKSYYLKNILPHKYKNEIMFATITGDYVESHLREVLEKDDENNNYKGFLSNSHTDKLRYLKENIIKLIKSLYDLKRIPICLVWDEFENVILSLGHPNENILVIKEILDKINESDIPVFFIFLTNDYKKITDNTLYRRGRIDYKIDINDKALLDINIIENSNMDYFKDWLYRKSFKLDKKYKINDIHFIEQLLQKLNNVSNIDKKDLLCFNIYEDIK